EIEAQLRRVEGVADAAVLPVLRDGHAEALVAFIVADGQVPAAEIRQREGVALAQWVRSQLRARLPAYALPRTVRKLSAPPLTPNGKLDRRALETLIEP
ncbi:MAG: hypothetical protein M1118_14175, partial [Chloroflexi bacterium]|nr:hypothetical protein [Chloroflexota bacterium]